MQHDRRPFSLQTPYSALQDLVGVREVRRSSLVANYAEYEWCSPADVMSACCQCDNSNGHCDSRPSSSSKASTPKLCGGSARSR